MIKEDAVLDRDTDKPLIGILKGTIEEQKRINKRNFLLIILLVVMLILTNTGWFIYEYKMADVSAKTESNLIQDATNADNSTNNFASQEVKVDGKADSSGDPR